MTVIYILLAMIYYALLFTFGPVLLLAIPGNPSEREVKVYNFVFLIGGMFFISLPIWVLMLIL